MLTIWQKRQLWIIQTGFCFLPNVPLVFNQSSGAFEVFRELQQAKQCRL